MAELLEVSDFALRDDAQFEVALPELRLAAGCTAALYSRSGGGKTSLLLALFGLLARPGWRASGRAVLQGLHLGQLAPGDLRAVRRRRMAFLMQDAHSALDPLAVVGTQIEIATGKPRAAAVEMLARLGVDDAAGVCARQPHRISGGQAQRVMLAIAFLRAPALVVADEPSASLDGGSYAELITRLRQLVAAGSGLLLATHDHRLLRDLDAEVYGLVDGRFVRTAPSEQPWPARPAGEVGTVPVLRAADVTVRYGERLVLEHVDVAVHRREIVALLGESGAGKTTLLRVLAGHRSPDAGAVVRPSRPAAVQMLCQDALASLTPHRRLRSLLAEAHAPSFDAAVGAAGVDLPAAVLERTSAAMSGGERRRAALLRALAVQPDVLLLDEPTASLDRAAAVAVIDNLLALQRSRAMALVVATHDEALADAIAHRKFVIRGGRLCEL